MRGVTKPVVLTLDIAGVMDDPWGNKRLGATATTKVNRQDFGVAYNKTLETGGVMVGNDVEITIDIEGVSKKAAPKADKK
jgi:polyisoprenoid-binding protein YceI